MTQSTKLAEKTGEAEVEVDYDEPENSGFSDSLDTYKERARHVFCKWKFGVKSARIEGVEDYGNSYVSVRFSTETDEFMTRFYSNASRDMSIKSLLKTVDAGDLNQIVGRSVSLWPNRHDYADRLILEDGNTSRLKNWILIASIKLRLVGSTEEDNQFLRHSNMDVTVPGVFSWLFLLSIPTAITPLISTEPGGLMEFYNAFGVGFLAVFILMVSILTYSIATGFGFQGELEG